MVFLESYVKYCVSPTYYSIHDLAALNREVQGPRVLTYRVRRAGPTVGPAGSIGPNNILIGAGL